MISIIYQQKTCPYCKKRIRAGVCRNHKQIVLDFYAFTDGDEFCTVFQIMYFNGKIPRANSGLRDAMIYSVQFELPAKVIYCGDFSNKRVFNTMQPMPIEYFDPLVIPLDEVLQKIAVYRLFS